MKLSLNSATRLSAENFSIKEKLSVDFTGKKVLFALCEESNRPEYEIEIAHRKIAGDKNQINPLFGMKVGDELAKVCRRTGAQVCPVPRLFRVAGIMRGENEGVGC